MDGKVLTLDYTTKEFTANGKKYFVEEGLSIRRYEHFQKLQIELGYNIEFYELFKVLKLIYDEYLNKSKFAQAATSIYNIMIGVGQMQDGKPDRALMLCTLFMNEESEDRKNWNIDLANKKINDWKEEGIDVNFFLFNALTTLKNYTNVYRDVTENISNEITKMVDMSQ